MTDAAGLPYRKVGAGPLDTAAVHIDTWVPADALIARPGGGGYLVDETPIGRWWRDMKLARVGGGTDEVLWELVAATMKPDCDGYAELIGRGNA
jgi:hypothetical protein